MTERAENTVFEADDVAAIQGDANRFGKIAAARNAGVVLYVLVGDRHLLTPASLSAILAMTAMRRPAASSRIHPARSSLLIAPTD